jgi:hypothetical protein
MLPLLAVPVLHSSGAFIAYSGTGYLAGTLSSSWLGAFVLGNSGLLAGASALTATSIGGFLSGAKSSATGVAASLGLISSTPAWVMPVSIASGIALVASGGFAYYKRGQIIEAITEQLEDINQERISAGLKPFNEPADLFDEVLDYIKSMKKSKGDFDAITEEQISHYEISSETGLVPVEMVEVEESWLSTMSKSIGEIADGVTNSITDAFTGRNHTHDYIVSQSIETLLSERLTQGMNEVELRGHIASAVSITKILPQELRVTGTLSDETLECLNNLTKEKSERWSFMVSEFADKLKIKLT